MVFVTLDTMDSFLGLDFGAIFPSSIFAMLGEGLRSKAENSSQKLRMHHLDWKEGAIREIHYSGKCGALAR